MAKNDIAGSTSKMDDENIPVVTIPGKFSKSYGNIFLIIAVLIAEAIGAYTVVALNYSSIYEYMNGVPPNFGATYQLPDIVVNPAGSKGSRFLVVSINIQLRSQADLDRIKLKEFMIKDAINTLLSKKTVDELQSVDGRINLKQEIGIVVNNILKDEAVQNVYFTKYVMQ